MTLIVEHKVLPQIDPTILATMPPLTQQTVQHMPKEIWTEEDQKRYWSLTPEFRCQMAEKMAYWESVAERLYQQAAMEHVFDLKKKGGLGASRYATAEWAANDPVASSNKQQHSSGKTQARTKPTSMQPASVKSTPTMQKPETAKPKLSPLAASFEPSAMPTSDIPNVKSADIMKPTGLGQSRWASNVPKERTAPAVTATKPSVAITVRPSVQPKSPAPDQTFSNGPFRSPSDIKRQNDFYEKWGTHSQKPSNYKQGASVPVKDRTQPPKNPTPPVSNKTSSTKNAWYPASIVKPNDSTKTEAPCSQNSLTHKQSTTVSSANNKADSSEKQESISSRKSSFTEHVGSGANIKAFWEKWGSGSQKPSNQPQCQPQSMPKSSAPQTNSTEGCKVDANSSFKGADAKKTSAKVTIEEPPESSRAKTCSMTVSTATKSSRYASSEHARMSNAATHTSPPESQSPQSVDVKSHQQSRSPPVSKIEIPQHLLRFFEPDEEPSTCPVESSIIENPKSLAASGKAASTVPSTSDSPYIKDTDHSKVASPGPKAAARYSMDELPSYILKCLEDVSASPSPGSKAPTVDSERLPKTAWLSSTVWSKADSSGHEAAASQKKSSKDYEETLDAQKIYHDAEKSEIQIPPHLLQFFEADPVEDASKTDRPVTNSPWEVNPTSEKVGPTSNLEHEPRDSGDINRIEKLCYKQKPREAKAEIQIPEYLLQYFETESAASSPVDMAAQDSSPKNTHTFGEEPHVGLLGNTSRTGGDINCGENLCIERKTGDMQKPKVLEESNPRVEDSAQQINQACGDDATSESSSVEIIVGERRKPTERKQIHQENQPGFQHSITPVSESEVQQIFIEGRGTYQAVKEEEEPSDQQTKANAERSTEIVQGSGEALVDTTQPMHAAHKSTEESKYESAGSIHEAERTTAPDYSTNCLASNPNVSALEHHIIRATEHAQPHHVEDRQSSRPQLPLYFPEEAFVEATMLYEEHVGALENRQDEENVSAGSEAITPDNQTCHVGTILLVGESLPGGDIDRQDEELPPLPPGFTDEKFRQIMKFLAPADPKAQEKQVVAYDSRYQREIHPSQYYYQKKPVPAVDPPEDVLQRLEQRRLDFLSGEPPDFQEGKERPRFFEHYMKQLADYDRARVKGAAPYGQDKYTPQPRIKGFQQPPERDEHGHLNFPDDPYTFWKKELVICHGIRRVKCHPVKELHQELAKDGENIPVPDKIRRDWSAAPSAEISVHTSEAGMAESEKRYPDHKRPMPICPMWEWLHYIPDPIPSNPDRKLGCLTVGGQSRGVLAGEWNPTSHGTTLFLPTITRVSAFHAWLDDVVWEALHDPFKLDINHPGYRSGEVSVSGLSILLIGVPADAMCIPPDPPSYGVIEWPLPEKEEARFVEDPYRDLPAELRADRRLQSSQRAIDSHAAWGIEHRQKLRREEEERRDAAAYRLSDARWLPEVDPFGPPNTHDNPMTPRAYMYVRPARPGDEELVAEIYNWWVEHTIHAPHRKALPKEHFAEVIRQCADNRLPFLVACSYNNKLKGRRRKVLGAQYYRERIIGFVYAQRFREEEVFESAVELKMFVDYRSLRYGVAKNLMDRVLPALDPQYQSLCGCDFFKEDHNVMQLTRGGGNGTRKIIVSVYYPAAGEEGKLGLVWKTNFLRSFGFEPYANFHNIASKTFGFKHLHTP